MRIALGVEYDGSAYNGWQSQPDVPNVQDTLQLALSKLAGEPIAILTAGRTDTGVHALEQVVHFDTNIARPLSAWVRGTNALLPKDIAVLWAHPVSEEFHARFSAQARSYQYVLLNRPSRMGVHHGKVGWFHAGLDVVAMRKAASYLLGEHDFSAFRSSQCQAKSPIKHLYEIDIQQQGETIIVNISGNAFLHHMVRNIMGCLLYVGKGKYPPQWMETVLAGKNRKVAAPTFMPDGLYLRHITYDAKWGLPQGTMPTRL
ncbi:MAG: tRNA pseudouridine(38-40) synthase TruA [Sideroxydans sp.]|nr:tRNA pseudouridine(38-40) synthase TruA [Sideroxydans sp.]